MFRQLPGLMPCADTFEELGVRSCRCMFGNYSISAAPSWHAMFGGHAKFPVHEGEEWCSFGTEDNSRVQFWVNGVHFYCVVHGDSAQVVPQKDGCIRVNDVVVPPSVLTVLSNGDWWMLAQPLVCIIADYIDQLKF